MKNDQSPIEAKSNSDSDTNKKMLFNSDGFELIIKILSVSVKFIIFMLGAILCLFSGLLSQPKKSKFSDNYECESDGCHDNFVSTDITDIDARINGKGYYK